MNQEPPRLTPFQSLYLSLAIAGMSFTIGLSIPRTSFLRVGSYFTGGVGLLTAAVLARRPMERFEQEYATLLDEWNKQVATLESSYEEKSAVLKKEHQAELTALKSAHADELEEAIEKIETHQANLFAAQRNQQDLISHAIDQGLAASRTEIERLKSEQATEIENLKKLAAQQHKDLQAERDRAIEANEKDFRVKLTEIRTQHKRACLALVEKLDQKMQQFKATGAAHVKAQLATAQNTINTQAKEIKGLLELIADHEQTLNHLQQKSVMSLLELQHENQLLKVNSAAVQTAAVTALTSPRKFSGSTSIDQVGNRIIDHFAGQQIILDALDSPKIPGGFCLRYRLDRNSPQVKLNQEIFDKEASSVGLWGLSYRPLEFKLDPASFLLIVNVYTSTPEQAEFITSRAPKDIASRFSELNCFPAAEFESVIRSKFVPRVRVVAGSTGGKSPLMELIACAIAQINGGQLWLLNPIPGSPKDWFSVPGVIPPGVNGIESAIAWLQKAHKEFQDRRNDLSGTANKDFITVMVDEINSIARDYSDLGTVLKDFYQLSDHTRMGFLTAGQGGNVSGVSGGSKANAKTGNAGKLMEEDFDNATQVFTAAAARTWLDKKYLGSQKKELLEALTALNKLCDELNAVERKSAYPADIAVKKVDPDAYRIALVVSPRSSEPFFIQIPPYSSYAGKMEGVKFPPGSMITAPIENQQALGLLSNEKPADECEYCGATSFRRKGVYQMGSRKGQPRYVCSQCQRVPSSEEDVES